VSPGRDKSGRRDFAAMTVTRVKRETYRDWLVPDGKSAYERTEKSGIVGSGRQTDAVVQGP